MKRLISIASIGVLAVSALVLVQCDELLGGAPRSITIEAMSDSTVKITWGAPTEGAPDAYIVSFMEVGTSSYAQVAETTATSIEHDPSGATGMYKVEAKFGSDTYAGSTTPTTEPIANAVQTVSELNAAGNAGYGWNTSDGSATTYTMGEVGSAPNVDLYFTDWALGFTGPNYSIASPDEAEADPGNGGFVPPASWATNSFSSSLTSETAPLPVHTTATYFNYTDITQTPFIVGCYTEDGYYAMVKINSYNTGSGEFQVQSWFQLVEGLRLIKH